MPHTTLGPRLAALFALLLSACARAPAPGPTVTGEEVLASFLEHPERLVTSEASSGLVVRVLAPEGWRSGVEGSLRPCVSVRAGGALIVPVADAPESARLVVGLAIRRHHYLGTGRVRARLETSRGGSSVVELDSSATVPTEERHWIPLSVPLAGADEVTLRLDYEGTAQPPHVLVSELELRRPVERQRTLACTRFPSVLLVVIDTLRADALGAHGYTAAATPVMDELAASGLLFERAYSTAPWTVPATASILTALPPPEHGVDFDSIHDPAGKEPVLAASLTTLAEAFAEAGFATAGISCNPLVARRSNLDQGFETFVRFPWSQAHEGPIDRAASWLAEREGERFFLYLHLVDPHGPYEPDEPFAERFSAPLPEAHDRLLDGSLQDGLWKGEVSLEDFQEVCDYARVLYDGEVASVDAQLGRLLEELERSGLARTTIVAITSDHGEEFAEHGALGHVNNLFDETLRVPLLLAGPGLPRGERVPFPVENRSIGPTLLHLARVPRRGAFDQPSLVEAGRAGGPLFFATRNGRTRVGASGRWRPYDQLFGVLDGDLLLHWSPPGPRWEHEIVSLYDLAQDPAATTDLSRQRPQAVERLRDLIENWLRRGESARASRNARAAASEVDLEELRGLGYLGDEDQ